MISDDVVQRLLKFFLNRRCYNDNLFDVLIEFNKDMSEDSLKYWFCADAYIPGIMGIFVYLGSDYDQDSIEAKRALVTGRGYPIRTLNCVGWSFLGPGHRLLLPG